MSVELSPLGIEHIRYAEKDYKDARASMHSDSLEGYKKFLRLRWTLEALYKKFGISPNMLDKIPTSFSNYSRVLNHMASNIRAYVKSDEFQRSIPHDSRMISQINKARYPMLTKFISPTSVVTSTVSTKRVV